MKPIVLIFDKHCIVKNIFHKCKEPMSINKVDIKNIVLSKKYSYDNKGAFKYFIGYDDHKIGITALYIILPQMNAYTKYFKDSTCVNFSANDKKVLLKCSEIWNKIKSVFKKEFDSKPMYKDKLIKTKVNLYNTPFLCKKIPKEKNVILVYL